MGIINNFTSVIEKICEKLSVILLIVFVLIVIFVAVCFSRKNVVDEHTSFYNSVAENVKLPSDDLRYYVIDDDNEISLIEIKIWVDNMNVTFNDMALIYDEIRTYVRNLGNYDSYDIAVVFYSFSAGTDWYVSIIESFTENIEIKCYWNGIKIKDLSDAFPNAGSLELYDPALNGKYYDDALEFSDFSGLNSITCINWRFSEEEKNDILSLFPECEFFCFTGSHRVLTEDNPVLESELG